MVFVRDEHVDERSALDVGFCFALAGGRWIKNGQEEFSSMALFAS